MRGYSVLIRYMRERSRAWLFLTALLFVALIEVKMLMAGQLMCSLGLAAIVYLIFFSNADLFKIAGCTAIAAIPLVCWVLLKNRERRTDRHEIRAMALCLACDADAWIGQLVERPACFRGCSAANLPCGLPWAARHWRSRNPHCNIPPKTRGRSPVLAWDFRGDRRGHRAHVQLYASRMDLSIQPS